MLLIRHLSDDEPRVRYDLQSEAWKPLIREIQAVAHDNKVSCFIATVSESQINANMFSARSWKI